MKVKIYVNTDEYGPSDLFPRVLTEKQYQEKIEERVKQKNLSRMWLIVQKTE